MRAIRLAGVVKCIPQRPFFDISDLTVCINFYMFLIRFISDSIRIHLINIIYDIWNLLFLEMIAFMRCLNFLDVVRILHKHIRSYQFNQLPLLGDHQELACTPNNPTR